MSFQLIQMTNSRESVNHIAENHKKDFHLFLEINAALRYSQFVSVYFIWLNSCVKTVCD